MEHLEKYEINDHGFVKYPQRHIGRIISVAGAISTLKNPTSTSVIKYLGYLSKGSIDRIALKEMNEQLGIKVKKNGAVFEILSWGDLINKRAVFKYMREQI